MMVMADFDKIIDTLFDGPEDDIRYLISRGVEYRYIPESPEFFVGFGTDAITMHKCVEVPLCVTLFGNEQNMR